MIKYLFVALLIVVAAAFSKAPKETPPPQQMHVYTIRVTEDKLNSFLLIQQGRLEQVSAQDFNENQRSILEQLNAQARQYAQQDSIMRAQQKKVDTTKTKKP